MPFSDTSLHLKTAGELERELAQNIILLYKSQLKHAPEKVTCHLFSNRLIVLVEGASSPLEHLLFNTGEEQLSSDVQAATIELLTPQLQRLFCAGLKVNVVTLLTDTCIEAGLTGIIAILEKVPTVRNPGDIPKTKLSRKKRSRNAAKE